MTEADKALSLALFAGNPGKKFIFQESVSGIKLLASPFEVLTAEYALNRTLHLAGHVSVKDFLHYLGYTRDVPINGKLGWSTNTAASKGRKWIDLTRDFHQENGTFLIDYISPPEFDYMEAWE